MQDDRVLVENLAYTYRKGNRERPAVQGVTFLASAGEIFGLLGPNGAGKTTVVRILTTILRPTAGRALVAGHDVSREPLAVRRQIAAVFQENAVETLLSTWDNLLIFGYLHGQSRAQASQRAREVAELLELGEHLPQRAHTLSGGFKRRLQVAKALMVETPVLFLDEATTGMDPLIKRRVMAALREQARSGRTILLTTQLLDEAEALCDRLVLLNEGRQVASGRLADLRGLSRKRLRIQLGFAHPSDEAVQALRAFEPKYLEERHGEVILEVDGTEDEWLRRMAGISRRWPLAHLQIQGASLEQIFLELFEHPSPRA